MALIASSPWLLVPFAIFIVALRFFLGGKPSSKSEYPEPPVVPYWIPCTCLDECSKSPTDIDIQGSVSYHHDHTLQSDEILSPDIQKAAPCPSSPTPAASLTTPCPHPRAPVLFCARADPSAARASSPPAPSPSSSAARPSTSSATRPMSVPSSRTAQPSPSTPLPSMRFAPSSTTVKPTWRGVPASLKTRTTSTARC